MRAPVVSMLRPVLVAMCALALSGVSAVHAQQATGEIGPQMATDPQIEVGDWRGRRDSYGSDRWDYCARENQTCQVSGRATVRYGADGRYVYREVRDAYFRCDNALFGDPAPRRSKQCDIRRAGGSGWGSGNAWNSGNNRGWSHCAEEGQVCTFGRSMATVRYGVPGRYVEQNVAGGAVRCDNRTFGDPAPRQSKHCQIRDGRDNRGWNDRDDDRFTTGWTHCATEGGVCRLPGPATVRYGANGRYTTQQVQGGSVYCDNDNFGDPAPRDRKSCAYQLRTGGWQGADDGVWGSDDRGWRQCASEGQYCSFSGTRSVRYGVSVGRETIRRFSGGVYCGNEAFGSDPAPNEPKVCLVQD